MSRQVVFICTGNICRSPMAEFLYRTHIRSNPAVSIHSAGVMAVYGVPASRHAVTVLDELGVDARTHRSQPVTPTMVREAELLVVMTAQHREILTAQHPEAAARIVLLKSFDPARDGEDVMDPIGLSLDVYRHVRDEIARALWGLDLQMQNTAPDREDEHI